MDIAELSKVTGSRMKAQEVLLVAAGVKPCGRQGYYDSELDSFLSLLIKLELTHEISRFRVTLEDDGLFSNKGRISTDKKGMRFVYFSKDQFIASLAALSEAQGDVAALGSLLGYPSCCVQYFKSHFSAEHPDLELKSSDWRLRLDKRGADYCLLSHFPCAADCAASLAVADVYYTCLVAKDRDYAAVLKKKLSP